MPTIAFRITTDQELEALEALQRTDAANLNQMAKKLFFDFVSEKKNTLDQINLLNSKLDDVLISNQAMIDVLNEADFQTMYRIMGAIFMLTHGAVPANIKKRVDDVFNAKAITDFMEGKD